MIGGEARGLVGVWRICIAGLEVGWRLVTSRFRVGTDLIELQTILLFDPHISPSR